MDLEMDYELLKNMRILMGADNFFKAFEKTYSQFELYTMSQDWIKSKEYILKFKGGKGDIVVYWKK